MFTEDNGPVHTCDLSLPRFSEDAGVQLWTTVSQPFSHVPEPGRAFTPDPAEAVVVINMARAVPGTDAMCMCSLLLAIRVAGLLEQVRALLEHVRSHVDDPDPDSEHSATAPEGAGSPTPTATAFEYRVPWAQWGPPHTRFVMVPETWEAPSTYGRRCALAYHNAAGAPELALFDFGIDAPRVAVGTRTHAPAEGWSTEVLPAPTSVDMRLWFEDEAWVESRLPCRVRRRLLPVSPDQKVAAAMLWEDGVILKVSGSIDCSCAYVFLTAALSRRPAGTNATTRLCRCTLRLPRFYQPCLHIHLYQPQLGILREERPPISPTASLQLGVDRYEHFPTLMVVICYTSQVSLVL